MWRTTVLFGCLLGAGLLEMIQTQTPPPTTGLSEIIQTQAPPTPPPTGILSMMIQTQTPPPTTGLSEVIHTQAPPTRPPTLELSAIQTQDQVRAAVGEEARLNCQLTQPKNVLQVTWQKIIPGGTEDVGSCNKRFGKKINPAFLGLVKFENTSGLQDSTIVVSNFTKADTCCYRCLFNAYPEGAIYRETCLTVYEQPEPILHVTKPNNGTALTVSCEAQVMTHPAVTHPTLTVTLEVPGHVGSSNYSTVHTASANGTMITVTSTVTLERLCSNATQVRCVLRLSSGAVKEASTVIYCDKQDVCDRCEACPRDHILVVSCVAAVIGVTVIVLASFACGLVFRRQGKKRSYNDPETQTTINKTTEPLVPQDAIKQCPQKNKPIEYPNT